MPEILPKTEYHFLFLQKHEVIFHFGSYLSQMLMDFAQIWMIWKLSLADDIRLASYSDKRIQAWAKLYSNIRIIRLIAGRSTPLNCQGKIIYFSLLNLSECVINASPFALSGARQKHLWLPSHPSCSFLSGTAKYPLCNVEIVIFFFFLILLPVAAKESLFCPLTLSHFC